MGVREFSDEAMSTQQRKLASNGGTAAAKLGFCEFEFGWVEQSAQIGVTQAAQSELASATG